MKVSEADFLVIQNIHHTFLKTPFTEENIPVYEELVGKVIKILKRYFKKEGGTLENQLRFHQVFVQRIMLCEQDGKCFSPSEYLQ
jgi:hypothetical protein